MAATPMPINVSLLDPKTMRVNTAWIKWFNEMNGGYVLQQKIKSVVYNDTTYLSSSDFGKTVKFDNGSVNAGCYLPSVDRVDIDSWFVIMKLGSGSLTIFPDGSDTIEKSSPGGKVVCSESGRVCANLGLYLADTTKWAIMGGTGIWQVW